ncbi:exodeoxyribonuclease V subunit alpha [uncultured Paraglaciecola sp.]|uniref:exodeoxyribonuclease V subunit alpha n=1 Tax=uncultured Paraglaciecola sp. TaxID=1765024 RepID=UPI00261C1384|nr:exodeoxyribonuclease V subunit alpha [uncultured Paraglaciecola sp.]
MLNQLKNPPTLNDALQQLQQMAKIRAIDLAFADFVYSEELSLELQQRDCFAMLAAYVSAQSGEQHSCVDIEKIGQPFAEAYFFPELGILQSYLSNAHCIAVVPNTMNETTAIIAKPLVLQSGKLYLHRYWQYEQQLAAIIREKAGKNRELDVLSTQSILNKLFENSENETLDWQKVAVCIAASQSLCFITGGPGTGKTTTVTKLLALLQGLAVTKRKPLNIQLVAPTGKAAARLTESINKAKQSLPTELQTHLPEQCQTVHRLLGAKSQSPYFKADAEHPLHLDVLVLDEASMVDLPLMAKLFAALPDHAQVILLGDQDQLASVETGSVLSDICAVSDAQYTHLDSWLLQQNGLHNYSNKMQQHLAQLLAIGSPTTLHSQQPAQSSQCVIQDNLVRLIKSHRFDENSGIGQLATQVKMGQYPACTNLFKNQQYSDIAWYQPTQTSTQGVSNEILTSLIIKLLPIYQNYHQAVKQGDLAQAFNYLEQQQVLCAQKSGCWGVLQLNALIESEMHRQGLIDNSKDFYHGRPIMLSKNDHQLKLFNGDIGIVMADPNNSTLTKVWFVTPEGEYRGLLPSRLPSHDTQYAMTIHKSQGSEFESVYLCLPPITTNHQGRGLNRELIYTGLTRAKKQFMLFAEAKALKLSLAQQVARGSGLAGRLLL